MRSSCGAGAPASVPAISVISCFAGVSRGYRPIPYSRLYVGLDEAPLPGIDLRDHPRQRAFCSSRSAPNYSLLPFAPSGRLPADLTAPIVERGVEVKRAPSGAAPQGPGRRPDLDRSGALSYRLTGPPQHPLVRHPRDLAVAQSPAAAHVSPIAESGSITVVLVNVRI